MIYPLVVGGKGIEEQDDWEEKRGGDKTIWMG